MNYENLFNQNLETNLKGRYITLNAIEPLLLQFNSDNQVQIIGKHEKINFCKRKNHPL